MYLEKIVKEGNPPRAQGTLRLSIKGDSEIQELFQQGATKALFPRHKNRLECVMINTSGGLTGGDEFLNSFTCKDKSLLTLTTQGCERIYKSGDSTSALVENNIILKGSSSVWWLPQETLVFDQGRIKRKLKVELSSKAEALIVEPIIFGRLAMGEISVSGHFDDMVEIKLDNKIIFFDRTYLSGNISKILKRPAVADGFLATALIIYKSQKAKSFLKSVRDRLNTRSGISLIRDDFLVMRLLASTGYELRKMLVPIINEITDKNLPKTWSL